MIFPGGWFRFGNWGRAFGNRVERAMSIGRSVGLEGGAGLERVGL
jgi:hypothetical protein